MAERNEMLNARATGTVRAMLTRAEVAVNAGNPRHFNVEQFDDDGACQMAIFIGPDAESRAHEYAEFRRKE